MLFNFCLEFLQPSIQNGWFPAYFKQKRNFAARWMRFYVYFRLVKVFCILLSLLVFVLAAFPCNDSTTCAEDQKYGAIASNNFDSHSHSDNEVDQCTPFCTCSCCSAPVQITSFFSLHRIQLPLMESTSIYKSIFIQGSLHSIWQPPRTV